MTLLGLGPQEPEASAGEPGPGLIPSAGAVSRGRWLLVWAVVSVLAVAVAFLLGTRVRSPLDDAIANATARPTVTDVVRTRSLSEPGDAIRGTVRLGTTISVAPLPSDTDRQVVTAAGAAPGTRLMGGAVLLQVSGRPLVAWELPFSLYRSLAPGDSGEDVRAVQKALVDLDLLSGTSDDGLYGPVTARGVSELYRRAGVAAPSADQALLEAQKVSHDTLDEALDALDEARQPAVASNDGASSETTQATVDERAIEDAEKAVAEAREAAAEADLAAMTPLPLVEVLVIPVGGADVISVVPVGTVVGAEPTSIATLRSGSPSVVARAAVDQVDAFALGSTVSVQALDDPTVTVEGTVTSVGEFTPGADATPAGRDVTLALTDPGALTEDQEILVIPSGGSRLLEGLSVPLLAVRDDSRGTYVVRLGDEGEPEERVDVVVDGTLDGFAFVQSTDLAEGDTIVVATP